MLLLSDPRIAAVPVADNGEELRDVRDGGLLLDSREADPEGYYAQLRVGVIERLRAAEADLRDGIRLVIVEGYRSAAEQRRRFDGYVHKLSQSGVTDPAVLRRQASAFVSPVEVAPHCTGGAVDLTLVDRNGQELPMGGEVNGHRTGNEASCAMDAPDLSTVSRANRSLLTGAMTSAGFVNYPTEWWHWSFGDRYWAAVTGAPQALYGPLD